MVRVVSIFVALCATSGAVFAAAKASPPAVAAKSEAVNCERDLASLDRSFATALRQLQRTDEPSGRCTAWRNQIVVMQKASDVFARCTADDARKSAISQMEGSIADYRALITEAKCP